MDVWGIIAKKQGLVSLLNMLEFAAREYLELCHRFGLLLGEVNRPFEREPNVLGDSLTFLLHNGSRLGLNVTVEHLIRLMGDIAKQSPESVRRSEEGIQIVDGRLDPARMAHHVEAIYSTMLAEMSSILFKAIPRDRVQYCGPEWLKDSPISAKYPTSLKELQRGGTCYSLGQPTASVFHSMRALEPALNSLADHFHVSFAQENWQAVIQEVEAEIRKLGLQAKSQQKMEDEKFFGAAASHLYFVKNAWRNHVAHTRDSYSDDEALRVMQRTVQFIESLCPRLCEPA